MTITLSIVYLIVIAIAILVATRILYPPSGGNTHDVVCRGLMGVAATCIVIGAVVFVAVMTYWLSVPLLLIGLVVLFTAWIRFQRNEREDLLRILAAAADKGVPLPYAARAFAAERSDRLGNRASRLAMQLEGGALIGNAVDRSLRGLNTSTLVAVRLAEPLGNFGPALSQALGTNRSMETTIRAHVERFIYFYLLLVIMQGLLVFFSIKILPVYEKMYREMGEYLKGLSFPFSTNVLMDFIDLQYYVFIPITAILCPIIILYYLDLLPRYTPGLSRVLFPYDRAQVLRVLSWSMRAGKPFVFTLDLIAKQYPRDLVRSRAVRASRLLSGGRDWCDSLVAVRFLKPADVAVLRAAERAGNLAWALETLADSHLRRLVFQLRTISTILFPCLTILLGALIGFVCLGMFEPLVKLIEYNS